MKVTCPPVLLDLIYFYLHQELITSFFFFLFQHHFFLNYILLSLPISFVLQLGLKVKLVQFLHLYLLFSHILQITKNWSFAKITSDSKVTILFTLLLFDLSTTSGTDDWHQINFIFASITWVSFAFSFYCAVLLKVFFQLLLSLSSS